jgi:mannose-6-phosphate isomerase-like protein (cupin superfamily)
MHRFTIIIVQVFLCLCLACTGCFADYKPDITDPGVVLTDQILTGSKSDEYLTATDIIPLLQQQVLVNATTPDMLTLIKVQPGQAYSPSAIRSEAEAMYIIEGTAEATVDETVLRISSDDVIFIPAGSRVAITNTGTTPLRFITSISTGNVPAQRPVGLPMKRSFDSVTPITFGNESDKTRFSVSRMLSTNDEPLPLSFDLAVAVLPADSTIPEHALDSGQTVYILKGAGTISIGCISHEIGTGDLAYIPPNVVQKITAKKELMILLLTEPYYTPAKDHPVSGVC